MTFVGFRGPGVVNLGAPDTRTLADYGWTISTNTGYWYKTTTLQTYNQAEALANTFGGHLAYIPSGTENSWIYTQFDGPGTVSLRIGMYNNGGTQTWKTGDAVSYTNWGDTGDVPPLPEPQSGWTFTGIALSDHPFAGPGEWNTNTADPSTSQSTSHLMQIKDESALTEVQWLAIIADAP